MSASKFLNGISNIFALITFLVALGTLAEMTWDMANLAAKESKRGFLSISALNQQLESGK